MIIMFLNIEIFILTNNIMSIYSKDYNNQIMNEIKEPLAPDALKRNLYNIIENSTSQKDKGGRIVGFLTGVKKVSEDDIAKNKHYKEYVDIYDKWNSNEGTSKDKNKQNVFDKEKQIVDLIESVVKADDDARNMTQVVKDNAYIKADVKSDIDTIFDDVETISRLMKSNNDLTIQQKELDDRNKENTKKKNKIIKIIKRQIKQQKLDHISKVLEIKQQTDKTIGNRTVEIAEQQVVLNEKINELQKAETSLIGKDEIIKDLKSKMTAEETEEIIDMQNSKEGILTTITRILPLSWKNALGFNIGNIITRVEGVRPYTPNDTVDHFLHSLFKNESTEEPVTIYNDGVPVNVDDYRTDGGNNINKKKNEKYKNKKTESKNKKTIK